MIYISNCDWQRYAVLTAAAFAKEFLGYVDGEEIKRATNIGELLKAS